ncbi:hypothetical protein [Cupriavidus oxalaticus]|uniref:Uncharacterized protein n=1 Tax=Cupriavidus oxalaticus TaxID=96344 RepID=A0A375FJK7_9BURK|nr:hypothetical protein [Cupriavidus oxalaticus]WQD84447.1 hypothetical protein U0036_08150 [Cupriavidus oxalaticus]SPC06649.1 conserved hypothetical protein [Cupriavidus oxalaticus]SPC12367.1 conserved hypothetical protein [Cupriavidus oxalaticus]
MGQLLTQILGKPLAALEQCNVTAGREALLRLTSEYPIDALAPTLAMLVEVLERPIPEPVTSHAVLRDTFEAWSSQIVPAARRAFGDAGGTAWCLPLWRTLAQAASDLPFRRDMPEWHTAPLWIRAAEWLAARESIARIESWRRIPTTLAWMAETVYRLQGLESAWPLLAELAWLSPKRLGALMQGLGDSSLLALRRVFDANFDGDGTLDDLAWFPAWALTERPGLAAFLRAAEFSTRTLPEQGMRIMLEMLSLEREGRQHELLERRKALRDLHAGLFGAYIRTR